LDRLVEIRDEHHNRLPRIVHQRRGVSQGAPMSVPPPSCTFIIVSTGRNSPPSHRRHWYRTESSAFQPTDAEEDRRGDGGVNDAVHHAAGLVDHDDDLPAIDLAANARIEYGVRMKRRFVFGS